MDVDERVIVAPDDRERIAIVSVAIPAGCQLTMDPVYRFEGWLVSAKLGRYRDGMDRRTITTERPPTQHVTEEAFRG